MTKFDGAAVHRAVSRTGDASCQLICWFAAFPHAAYQQIMTHSLRARIVANGLAVIVSPLVFTLALFSNGTALLGPSPYLFLLPVVAFAVDRLLIAVSYTATHSGWLAVIRGMILLVSLAMAIVAGLLAESKNLVMGLHAKEDQATLQGAVASNLTQRRSAIDTQIARNEKDLMERNDVEREKAEALRLRDLECHGAGGIDRKSGTFIKGGGKCGPLAASHNIAARAAEARLSELERLKVRNDALVAQRDQLARDLNALIEKGRSPSNSMATLGRALPEAGLSVFIAIAFIVLFVLTAETFALVMSEVSTPGALATAVRFSEQIDDAALAAYRDAALAKVAKSRATQRSTAAEDLAPIDVSLGSGWQAHDKGFA